MAGVGPGDLHDAAVEFLLACAEALDNIPTYDPTLAGAPERQFVAPGTPALDCCPQLTVHTGTITEGDTAPGAPAASVFRVNRPAFIATAVRCVPAGELPPAVDQEEAARQINADRWALWNTIWNKIRAGTLFSLCNDVLWVGMTPLTPQGGCGGSVLAVTASLDGYEESP